MARTVATNFSGALQYPYATSSTDVFKKEDIQVLAQAVDQHDHTAGKGHSINTVPANASITNAMLGPDVARANQLVNPGFEVWSRGAGAFTTSGIYTADRWFTFIAGTDTLSVSRDTANADTAFGSQVDAACTFTLGTGAGGTALYQSLPSTDGCQFGNRTMSVSIRVRTATANAVRLGFNNGSVVTYSPFHTGGGTWQTLTATVTATAVPTMQLLVSFAATCTAYIDNAMLVVGSQPADYVPLHPADDLARCLRYYETATSTGGGIATGQAMAATIAYGGVPFKTKKAVTPTITFTGSWIAKAPNGTNIGGTAGALSPTIDNFQLGLTVSSGLTAGNASILDVSGGSWVAESNP